MAAIISVFNYNPLHLPQSGCYLGKKKKTTNKNTVKDHHLQKSWTFS